MFINFAASDLLTMCLTLRDQITKEFREYFINKIKTAPFITNNAELIT